MTVTGTGSLTVSNNSVCVSSAFSIELDGDITVNSAIDKVCRLISRNGSVTVNAASGAGLTCSPETLAVISAARNVTVYNSSSSAFSGKLSITAGGLASVTTLGGPSTIGSGSGHVTASRLTVSRHGLPVTLDAGAGTVTYTFASTSDYGTITEGAAYQWKSHTSLSDTEGTNIVGATAASFTPAENGYYSCAISGSGVSGETTYPKSVSAGTVALDKTALASVSGKSLTVSIEAVNAATLTAAQKNALGEQAESAIIVDINILADRVKTSSFNGGLITVSIPYAPKAGEDTSRLAVWYLADDGALTKMPGHYDAAAKAYVFTTAHLSLYVLMADTAEALPFEDVAEGSYYYNAVAWAVEKGVTSGTSATAFSPDGACTRGQMAAFLWNAEGRPEPASAVNPFTDVKADAYYYKAVLWAVEKGITQGTGDGTTFSPDGACTRGQMATFLYRYAGSPAATGSNPFTDVADSDYYCDAVIWAADEGVTQGTGDGTTFSPNDGCTRAQIVTFLYRFLVK